MSDSEAAVLFRRSDEPTLESTFEDDDSVLDVTQFNDTWGELSLIDPCLMTYAGMPEWKLALSTPVLGYQMAQGTGHFYYAPDSPEGKSRRRTLAEELCTAGLH